MLFLYLFVVNISKYFLNVVKVIPENKFIIKQLHFQLYLKHIFEILE